MYLFLFSASLEINNNWYGFIITLMEALYDNRCDGIRTDKIIIFILNKFDDNSINVHSVGRDG